jgi:hypothetical protein
VLGQENQGQHLASNPGANCWCPLSIAMTSRKVPRPGCLGNGCLPQRPSESRKLDRQITAAILVWFLVLNFIPLAAFILFVGSRCQRSGCGAVLRLPSSRTFKIGEPPSIMKSRAFAWLSYYGSHHVFSVPYLANGSMSSFWPWMLDVESDGCVTSRLG